MISVFAALVLSIYGIDGDGGRSPVLAYIVALTAFGATVATFLNFFNTKISFQRGLISIFIVGVLSVFAYANCYHAFALIEGGELVEIDFLTALYFSIVTLTTLGYGDFAPAESLRLMAALQAILGYLYLGTVVAIMSNTGFYKSS